MSFQIFGLISDFRTDLFVFVLASVVGMPSSLEDVVVVAAACGDLRHTPATSQSGLQLLLWRRVVFAPLVLPAELCTICRHQNETSESNLRFRAHLDRGRQLASIRGSNYQKKPVGFHILYTSGLPSPR